MAKDHTNQTAPVKTDAEKDSAGNKALDSFLGRESASAGKKAPMDKKRRNILILAVSAGVIALLIGLIIFLNHTPKPAEEENLYTEAWTIATVDEAGMHSVEVPTDSNGQPRQNGSGTLIDYTPSNISAIRVQNASGAFTIHAATENGQATVYRLEGYEGLPLQTGKPDDVANDAADLHFATIASTDRALSEFGLQEPRATVTVTYTDGTSAVVRVGDEAAAQAGTYISFGSANNVYLVNSDAVDSFFYKPVDFISREITAGATSADEAAFRRITLTGSHYPQKIVLEPNDDSAINYQYRIMQPFAGFADAVMSADIAGCVRDLFAEEVVAVNVTAADAATFLAPYGLGKEAYADVVAEYPDVTLHLRASAPDGEGNVYLVNAGDPVTGNRVVYRIQIGALGWASASVDRLAADTVLSVSRTAVDSLTLTAGDKTVDIDVDTRTQDVTTSDGTVEQITTTEAYYNDKLLDDESFTILLQNLTGMKNAGKTDAAASDKLLEIRYTYTTGRAADTVTVYQSSGKSCPVALNGAVIGSVSKTYADALVGNINDIIAGRIPTSL